MTFSTLARSEARPRVFLSYAAKDVPAANAIREALARSNINVRDVHSEIKPGDSVSATIGEAIAASDAVVVLLSKAANESQWVNREIAFALAGPVGARKPILPVLVEPGAELPPFLRDMYFVDLTKSSELREGINRIVDRLKTESRDTKSPELALAVAESEMKALQLERASFERDYRERVYRQVNRLTWVLGILAVTSLIVVPTIILPLAPRVSGTLQFIVGSLVGATFATVLEAYRRRHQQ